MTMTAYCTVDDVVKIDDHIEIHLSAAAGTTVRPFATAPDQEVPTIYSNTEGVVTSVQLTITIDGTETTLKPGDIVNVSSHFNST
jgi:hypothetical protein